MRVVFSDTKTNTHLKIGIQTIKAAILGTLFHVFGFSLLKDESLRAL